MIRIAACDGSEHTRSLLLSWTYEWMLTAGMEAECFGARDPEELEYECEEYGGVDLVFTEVEFENGIDRYDILMRLRIRYPATDVVIVTKRGRPYRSIFGIRPYGCLEKPMDKGELYHILKLYMEERRRAKFHFRYNKIYYAILVDHIIYLYHYNRKIGIYCTDGKYFECYMKMEEAEERLKASDRFFLRIQKSCMVNVTRLERFSATEAVMEDGTVLSVSRSHAQGSVGRYSTYYVAITGAKNKT